MTEETQLDLSIILRARMSRTKNKEYPGDTFIKAIEGQKYLFKPMSQTTLNEHERKKAAYEYNKMMGEKIK